jgi:hypothetical protein
MSNLWAFDAQARDPPEADESSRLWQAAPAAPFVRCTPEQWKKVVSTLYAALHLTPPSVIPPQHLSLTEVVAVIWRAKAFLKQIPPQGAISFTPICPIVWKPGLCDLCGSPLYVSSYGWPNRWRCDACILAMHLALGFLAPEQWLTGARASRQEHLPGDRAEGKGS